MQHDDWLALVAALRDLGLIVVSVDKETGVLVVRVPPIEGAV